MGWAALVRMIPPAVGRRAQAGRAGTPSEPARRHCARWSPIRRRVATRDRARSRDRASTYEERHIPHPHRVERARVAVRQTIRKEDLSIPIRHLRVLFAIPNETYQTWRREHSPTGYEYFCPHSSLATYNSQAMRVFLRQMSSAAQFRAKLSSG